MEKYKKYRAERKNKKQTRVEGMLPYSEEASEPSVSVMAAQIAQSRSQTGQTLPAKPTLPQIVSSPPLSLTPEPSTSVLSIHTPGNTDKGALPPIPELDATPITSKHTIKESLKALAPSLGRKTHHVAVSPPIPVPDRRSSTPTTGNGTFERVPVGGRRAELSVENLAKKDRLDGDSRRAGTPAKPPESQFKSSWGNLQVEIDPLAEVTDKVGNNDTPSPIPSDTRSLVPSDTRSPVHSDAQSPDTSWLNTESQKPNREAGAGIPPSPPSPPSPSAIEPEFEKYDSETVKDSFSKIFGVIKENPELQKHLKIGLGSAVDQFIQLFKEQTEGLKKVEEKSKQIGELEKNLGIVKKRFQNSEHIVSEQNSKLEERKTQNEKLQARIANLEREKSLEETNHKNYMNQIIHQYRDNEKGLYSQIGKLEAEQRLLDRQHTKEKEELGNSLKASYAKEKEELLRAHKQEIKEHQTKQRVHWNEQQERHKQELQGLRDQNVLDIRSLEDRYKQELNALRHQHQLDIERLEEQNEQVLQERQEQTNDLIEKWKEYAAGLNTTIKSKDAQHTAMAAKLDREKTKLQDELQEQKQKHGSFVRELKDSFENEHQEIEKKHDDFIETLRQQFSQEIQQAITKHENELSEYKQKLRKSRDALEQERKEHESELKDMEELHQGVIKHMEKSHQDALKEIEERYQDEMESLKEQITAVKIREKRVVASQTKKLKVRNEELTRALVSREHIKGLTDLQLGKKFKDLEILIEDFAQIAWENSKEQQWPLSERALQQFRGGRTSTSLLKQHIVQSCLWAILYDHVFATPFEIFGEEGKAMHREWAAAFDEDVVSSGTPAWPSPSKDSEEMRCEAIRKCREGLKLRNLENQKQNSSFERSLKATVSDLSRRLQRVASFSEGENEQLKEMVQKAAELWLETCSQRYRIMIVLPSAEGNIFGSSKVKSSVLKLIGKPEVRRIGNAQGDDFDEEDTAIQGWTGKPIVYEIR